MGVDGVVTFVYIHRSGQMFGHLKWSTEVETSCSGQPVPETLFVALLDPVLVQDVVVCQTCFSAVFSQQIMDRSATASSDWRISSTLSDLATCVCD